MAHAELQEYDRQEQEMIVQEYKDTNMKMEDILRDVSNKTREKYIKLLEELGVFKVAPNSNAAEG